MIIKRDHYVEALLDKRWNGRVKINSGDFFHKIVILDGNVKAWTDEDGIMYVGVIRIRLYVSCRWWMRLTNGAMK
jgi:hypothetical protein